MFHVVLYQPEIPPNTGNVIRLCANAGVELHLVHPLGFELDEARLRRAGLDYREYARIHEHRDLNAFLAEVDPARVYALSSHGCRRHTEPAYRAGDAFLFGPETRGLPRAVTGELAPERILRIPMRAGNRSLNLSNAVAVMVFEAWRQHGFEGGE